MIKRRLLKLTKFVETGLKKQLDLYMQEFSVITHFVLWILAISKAFELYNSFKMIDRDGEEVYPFLIKDISCSDPGIVTLNKEKPHNF